MKVTGVSAKGRLVMGNRALEKCWCRKRGEEGEGVKEEYGKENRVSVKAVEV